MGGPLIAISVVAYNAVTTLVKTLDRIPASVLDRIEEIFVFFDDSSHDETYPVGIDHRAVCRIEKLNIYRNSVNLGYGGRQKLGYDYAIRKGYDIVVLLYGDGQYAAEVLGTLLEPVEHGEADVVLGSRMLIAGAARRGGMPLYKFAGNKILTTFQNRMLQTRFSEFHSGYRVYRCASLQEIPYHRCSDDFHFDTEVMLQLLARGSRIVERPIPMYHGREIRYVNGVKYAFNVIKSTIAYRLHQNGLYFADTFDIGPPRYPLKIGRWSSHQQVLRLIPPGQRVLDVGCGDGTLARFLSERGCDIVGIDQQVGPVAKAACGRTYTADLDQGLAFLEEEAPFQTVLLVDVLSHVKEYDQLLEHCRQRLAPGGRLLISVGNVAHFTVRLGLLFGRFEYTPRGILERKHVVLFTLKSLKRLLASHRFRVTRVRVTPIPFEVVWPRFSNRGWVQALTGLSYAMAKLWKTLFAYQFIVTAEPVRPTATPEKMTVWRGDSDRAASRATQP